jgi:hypothetical protein
VDALFYFYIPVEALTNPGHSRSLKHMKVKRLSALRAGCIYPGNIYGTHFRLKLSAAGRITSMKNSGDTIRNRTRYLNQLGHRVHPTDSRIIVNKELQMIRKSCHNLYKALLIHLLEWGDRVTSLWGAIQNRNLQMGSRTSCA